MNNLKHFLLQAVLQDAADGNPAKPLVVDTNPLAEAVSAQVENKLVSMEKVKFSFRTTKIKTGEQDSAGKEIEKEWKRDTFEAVIPLLTNTGVIAALQQGDKTSELIKDAANDVIINRARGIINDKIESDAAVILGPDSLDLQQLTLAAIASLPKSERGAGIPKDAWTAFVNDYKAAMQTAEAVALFPDHKPRSQDVLEKHAIVLAGKFNAVRSRQDVIKQMLGFLDIWIQVSLTAEEHAACYEHLKAKGNALLQGETFDDL